MPGGSSLLLVFLHRPGFSPTVPLMAPLILGHLRDTNGAGVRADFPKRRYVLVDHKINYQTIEQAVSQGHWDRKEMESMLGDPEHAGHL